MNVFAGTAYIDVARLAEHRQLETRRLANLQMLQKTVALPFEDPVTYAVNAAQLRRWGLPQWLPCLDVAWESGDKPAMHEARTPAVNIQCGIIATS